MVGVKKRTYMRTVYIAGDGKEFDSIHECEHYEWMLNHQNLQFVKIYDENCDEFDDILSDDAYNYGSKVWVPTELAVTDLRDYAIYSGYCYFSQITEPGMWKFNEKESCFEKISDDWK